MEHGSKRCTRSPERESCWRQHVESQSTSGVSVRVYCRRHGLSQALFYAWRREIAKRDAEQGPHLPRTEQSVGLASRHRAQSAELKSPIRSDSAGLIAVEIVGTAEPRLAAIPTLEIEYPGGPVIRLRENASEEVLQRVMAACQQVTLRAVTLASAQVRSC